MLPRGSVFREPRGYLPGPLPANKWSRRTTMMNCEFGSSPVCLQLPASVPAYVSGRRGNVESIESDSYVLQTSPDHSGRNGRSNSTSRRGVPRGVHRRRGGGYHRVGGPGRGRGVGDPPLRSPPSGSGWGEGGSRPPSSCPVQNTPHDAFAKILGDQLPLEFSGRGRSRIKRASSAPGRMATERGELRRSAGGSAGGNTRWSRTGRR